MAYSPRLKEEYKSKVIAALTDEFGYKNVMQVPKLQKIVISKGVGAAVADKKLIDYALEEVTAISGQKAIATMSKKDVASFKLRKGMPIGVKVTLRGEKMYEFLDRLINAPLRFTHPRFRIRRYQREVERRSSIGQVMTRSRIEGQLEIIMHRDRDPGLFPVRQIAGLIKFGRQGLRQ